MRRRIWLPPTLAVGVGLIVTVAAAPPTSFLRQTNESNGHREPEYGAFGITLYQPSQNVPGLDVSKDFSAGLERAGLKNHPQVAAKLDEASRTIRKDEIWYWLRIDVKASPKEVADFYARQLTKARRHSMPAVDTVEGTCPDGKTQVRVLTDRRGSSLTDVLVDFSVPR